MRRADFSMKAHFTAKRDFELDCGIIVQLRNKFKVIRGNL